MRKQESLWARLQNYWRNRHANPENQQEVQDYLKTAQQNNVLSFEVSEMIEGVFQVADQHVRDVMVPRAQMRVLPVEASLNELIPLIVKSGHSRFPVVDDNDRDVIVGILLAKDLLEYFSNENVSDHDFDINDLLRPPVFIPESKRLNVLLRDFRTSRNHMAMVIDEYGGVAGLVTIEDVIEKIVGDIDDEFDHDPENYLAKEEDNSYTMKALMPVEAFNQHFNSRFNAEEFDTMGGVLLKAFGRLPEQGDSIQRKGFEFSILKSDKRRIYRIKVTQL